jgi:predicted metal-binding protein
MSFIGMDDCGGCPGVVMPKVALMADMSKIYERDFGAVHFGTCMINATRTAKCPIDLEDLKKRIETKFKKEVILGTHPYYKKSKQAVTKSHCWGLMDVGVH